MIMVKETTVRGHTSMLRFRGFTLAFLKRREKIGTTSSAASQCFLSVDGYPFSHFIHQDHGAI